MRAPPSASLGDHNDALNIAMSMRIDEQWQMLMLRNVEHLGIASLAQQMSALSTGATGQSPSFDRQTASRLGVFSIFNSPAQMLDTLHAGIAGGASLSITPTLNASSTAGDRGESLGCSGEHVIELTVCADAHLTNAATCGAFLDDLTAMFAEPRRALL